jgi:putative nucleotidyltransferase with HDIG domain
MPETRERSPRLHPAPPLGEPDRASPGAVRRRRREPFPRHRLSAAFEAFDTFPALSQSRARLLSLLADKQPSKAAIVATIESDVALTIRVMREANGTSGRADSIVKAVGVLSPQAIRRLAERAPTFDFFAGSRERDRGLEQVRLHAIATQRASERLAREVRYRNRDRLMVTALLHDLGKLVLVDAYPSYPNGVHGDARTPEERVARERRELVVDHALVGGALARRWGLPDAIATAIERHHSEDARGDAAFVRLADMLAHFAQGDRVAPRSLLRLAAAAGLGATELRAVMCDLPYPDATGPRAVDPCPLSSREMTVLEHLAAGRSYQEIGDELALVTSTVRTHLMSIYRKLDAIDRAQAVLIATRRGWLPAH